MIHRNLFAVFVLTALAAHTSLGQRFYPDDPVREDPDQQSIPEPKVRELSKTFDFLERTFLKPAGEEPVSAVNVNTLGEVPDSSWFTNRIGQREMTLEELKQGPNRGNAPHRDGPLMIISGKDAGITPGFWAKDSKGDVYLLKFDPLSNPQLATSAEVIATKFFYAFGYHVPENYLVQIDPEQLQIAPEATFTDRWGVRRKFEREDLNSILKRIPRLPEGKIQAMASLRLKGKPLGPFKFYGTRRDDPNDVFPHEDRRELRGYRIFSAWLNHNDSDAVNTLDLLVEENGQRFIRHHLIDFGTTLGSAAIGPKSKQTGHDYALDVKPALKTAGTLGLWERPWMSIDYPDLPSVGRFEADFFEPDAWKPDYPNPAFRKMQVEDAFWATRIVSRFSDEMIRAVLETGRLVNPQAESYLADVLIERRDKIIRHYLSLLNPLSDFQLALSEGSLQLRFLNLGVQYGPSGEARYTYEWVDFDNLKETLDPIGSPQTVTDTSIPVPEVDSDYLMVRIRTLSSQQPAWEKKIDVYLRMKPAPVIVGIDREVE